MKHYEYIQYIGKTIGSVCIPSLYFYGICTHAVYCNHYCNRWQDFTPYQTCDRQYCYIVVIVDSACLKYLCVFKFHYFHNFHLWYSIILCPPNRLFCTWKCNKLEQNVLLCLFWTIVSFLQYNSYMYI